ncbi:MAG: hypothetical protein A2W03_17015 [Candidatus Aminicenantes bacterium RBG_16_63_16]|nr:MAG: hypothetical protein A2W03_17015 [Candidatus Aminicenantes bacterium RBG_16_63_16]
MTMTAAAVNPEVSRPRGQAAGEKPESLEAIFARKIAHTKANPFYKWLHTPHNRRFLPKPWRPEAGEFLIDGEWSVRAAGKHDDPGPFALQEIRSFFRDAGGFALAEKPTMREFVLRVEGRAGDRLEGDGYSLTAADGRVEITSPTWRGVLYGVFYLEQLLLERGMPALKPMSITRRPDFDVRMFGDVYGTFTVSGLRINRPVNRDTFSALSRFGANATFTFVNLTDYLDGSVYPELGNPDREKNLAELARLANLCRSVGLDLYLDAYNPKLPSNHPVFLAHPNARGASQHGHDIRSLCPSDPGTLRFIADSWADVFRRVPALGGMVTIIGGEGFYHCYMRAGKDGPDCPRCRNRAAEDVVADLTNAVFRAVRKVKPDAELLAWPYSAFVWSKDPYQLGLIEKLDPGIQLVSEIDKDHLYQKEGYVKNIWDYSIDFLGPSDRFRAMKTAVEKRGLKLCSKTETSVSLEFHSIPYIPCLQRWGERLDVIRAQRPASIYYAYDIAGFTRSRSEELAGRLSWEPAGTAAEEILKIARRDFGPEAAGGVIEGWRLFSEAVGHCPHLTHSYYRGPSFIGAAQPLMLNEENMPEKLFGRFFYLAEEDLSEGTGQALKLRPIYTENIKISPAEIADMDKAVKLWEEGVAAIESARAKVPAPYLEEFQKEADLGAYLLTVFRAIAAGNHFFTLRAEYAGLTKGPEISEGDRARAAAALREMEKTAAADTENARQALAIARRDPRLDFSIRLDLDYPPLTEMIEARIRFQENEAKSQFAAARLALE